MPDSRKADHITVASTSSQFTKRLEPEAEKKLLRARDLWRCIYAKVTETDVAHLIPQTCNDTKENIELTLFVIVAAEAFFDHSLLCLTMRAISEAATWSGTCCT